jgi:hypothetical protein
LRQKLKYDWNNGGQSSKNAGRGRLKKIAPGRRIN